MVRATRARRHEVTLKHHSGERYWSALRAGHHIDEIRSAAKAAVSLS
jgi:hypothetical protein